MELQSGERRIYIDLCRITAIRLCLIELGLLKAISIRIRVNCLLDLPIQFRLPFYL